MEKLYKTEMTPKQIFLVGIRDTRLSKGQAESYNTEIKSLIYTLGFEIANEELVHVRDKQPKFGMGSGKAAEIAEKAKAAEVDFLVFDWDASPSQQRSWEELTDIPIIDRQELIIKIFAAHAKTKEAELQVKLAELEYSLPRLTHKYVDLSRQHGGHYGTRGSGETKLETDRRRIQDQIQRLEKELDEVKKQRDIRRKQRERQGIPVCAIVGYTNAGKSSLLNALTGAGVLVEDKLFATLDTTTKRLEYKPGSTVLLTDTVGFIRRLPHSLIKAFRSTLEEATLADLLIHVLDASEPEIDTFYHTTLAVLEELGVKNIPMITVLNKIDRLKTDTEEIESLLTRFPDSIITSVKNRIGLEELKQRIGSVLETGKTVISE
ncbi:MAG: GTPase HflX [Treponema sp.]|nr:GTPase HflX [Treponema sp.]